MTTERAQPIDPYEVLGVARDANVDEIHAAYRRLARRVHPDVATKDASEMAQINEAWRILRRSAQHGHVATKETSATTRRGTHLECGHPWPTTVRRRFVAVAIVSLAVTLFLIAALVLIAFGRVGVTPAQ